MGDLHVMQVVLELRSSDPSPVRVHDVAFQEIEPRVVAQTQIVRVSDKTCVPLEVGLYSSKYLRSYRFQPGNKVREPCRLRNPQRSSHGRPRGMDCRSDDGVGDVCAETLDIEGIVQESVTEIVRVVGYVKDRVH